MAIAKTLMKPNVKMSEIVDIVQHSIVYVTCTGERRIYTKGGQDDTQSVDLDTFSFKFASIFAERMYDETLSVNDRLDALSCARLLKDCYQITEKQLTQSNCITRLLAWLRDFFQITSVQSELRDEIPFLREKLLKNPEPFFLNYTKPHFTRQFPHPIPHLHPACKKEYPDSIVARETYLQQHRFLLV